MYKNAPKDGQSGDGAAPGAEASDAGSRKKDDAIDAEFEEAKE